MRLIRMKKLSGDRVAFFPDGSLSVEELVKEGVAIRLGTNLFNVEGTFDQTCDNLDAERESWTGNR